MAASRDVQPDINVDESARLDKFRLAVEESITVLGSSGIREILDEIHAAGPKGMAYLRNLDLLAGLIRTRAIQRRLSA
jgi:hypothetical protein